MKLNYSFYNFALLIAAVVIFAIGVQIGTANPNNFGLALLALSSVFLTGYTIGRTSVSRYDSRFVGVAWSTVLSAFALSFGFDIGSFARDPISSVEVFVGGGLATAITFFAGGVAGAVITLKVRKYPN